MRTNGVRHGQLPAVVLVHGAWLDGSSWREVIVLLQKRGYEVTAAQHSLLALRSDVEAVHRVLDRQRAPVILVGHDYGGTVITEAGQHPNVAGLLYIAAFAPDTGECTDEAQRRRSLPPYMGRPDIDAAGFALLPPDVFREHFAHDLPAVESRVLAATQMPIRAAAFHDRVHTPAWRDKRSWYLHTLKDRMIDPALQSELSAQIRAKSFTLKSGHVPFLSQPQETALIICATADDLDTP